MPGGRDERDEIDEIKELLEHSVTNSSSVNKKTGQERTGLPAAPQKAVSKQSGLPAVPQNTGSARAGLPAVPQNTGSARTGLPAVPQNTGLERSTLSVTAQKAGKEKSGALAAPKKNVTEEIKVRRDTDSPIITGKPSSQADEQQIDIFEPPHSDKQEKRSEPELDVGSEKFKVKFDIEGAYRDVPEDRPLRPRRERRTGCIGGVLYAAFVICVSLVLASLVWMAAVDVLGFGAADEQINITVPSGFAMDDVTEMLYDAGLIKYKFLFNIYASYSKAEDKITAGQYILNMNFDYRALVQGMTARAGIRDETTVPIPEGYTLSQIFTRLVDYGVCQTEEELWETAKNYDFKYSFLDKSTLGDERRLEGFLFPETYNFYKGSTPVQAITKFLNEFNKRFTEQYTERAEFMGYSVRDIITIASMIEREAGDDEERPRIAAVIYNRLNNNDFPHLQIDATIYYAIAGTGRPFSTEIDSPYNTYTAEGLPPGPIANPGMASIRAALYPETTNEYYYALNKTGTHNFFRTLAQQQAFVQSDEYGGQ